MAVDHGYDEELVKLAENWIAWDPVQETRDEIAGMVAAQDWQQLDGRLRPRISFGTAGLRAKMQAGFAFMNSLTVLQASQGLCRYLEEQHGGDVERLRSSGVVIGYDGRHHSREYARITAAVFLSQGVRVHLFSELVPTPFVPFGVLHLGAAAGVMVTASHNPKQDNGYKVYWGNGCQIVEPHDRGIAAHIAANLAPWSAEQTRDDAIDAVLAEQRAAGRLVDPLSDVAATYYRRVADELCFDRAGNAANAGGLRIAFTPMHGVGGRWMTEAFAAFALPPFVPVARQMQPDADFPTVAFPNPEEGKGALQLAMETADAAGAQVILANDPDADRLAVAERQPDGSWRIFTGNETGALFASHMWTQFRRRHPDVPADQCFMVNSTVSSKFISAMAAREGFRYAETLTGFKWLGSKAIELSGQGAHFLFAFEEAIGFLVGSMGWDKDGVRCGAVMAEMASGLYAQGQTLAQHLEQLYARYGYFVTKNSYFFNYRPDVMFRMFERMRSLTPAGYPPACGRFPIRAVRDLMTGVDTSQPDGKAVLPVSKSSPMTTFYFENGAVVTIRGSGTEPKLKYYCELSGSDRARVVAELDELVQAVIDEFLCPTDNGYKPPAH